MLIIKYLFSIILALPAFFSVLQNNSLIDYQAVIIER